MTSWSETYIFTVYFGANLNSLEPWGILPHKQSLEKKKKIPSSEETSAGGSPGLKSWLLPGSTVTITRLNLGGPLLSVGGTVVFYLMEMRGRGGGRKNGAA